MHIILVRLRGSGYNLGASNMPIRPSPLHRWILRFSLCLALVMVLAGLAEAQLQVASLGTDDAHIFFVYGRNLISGHGLVYNPGGERVEGFTSFLWMILVAGAVALSSQPEPLLLAVCIALTAASLSAMLMVVDHSSWISWRGVFALAWCAAWPGFIAWSTVTLMDNALWLSMLTISALACLHSRSSLPLCLVIPPLLLSRPEAALWVPGLLAVIALRGRALSDLPKGIRAVAAPLAIYLLTLGGLALFRMLYFGYPLPNTYYAKVSPDLAYNLAQGARYLIAFLYANPQTLLGVVPALAALPIAVMWRRAQARSLGEQPDPGSVSRYLALSAMALLGLLIPVSSGGDHFSEFRFYQPVYPLLLTPLFGLVEVIPWRPRREVSGAVFMLGSVLLALAPSSTWFNQGYLGGFRHEMRIADEGERTGLALNGLFETGPPSIGVVRSGGIAWTYRGQVIDLLGLNNTAMGHSPGERRGIKNHAAFNSEVFFHLRPTLLLPTAETTTSFCAGYPESYAWNNSVLKGLLEDAQFLSEYRLMAISDKGSQVIAYVRSSALARILAPYVRARPFACP